MSLDAAETDILVSLLARERWACLATVDDDGSPLAAMVAFVPHAASGDLLLHLSTLARHTRNLLDRPRVSLAVSEQYRGEADPQTLARVAMQGEARPVLPDQAGFAELRDAYVTALPEAEARFGFADFRLLRLEVSRARYIGGFARAFAVDGAALRSAARAAALR